MKNRTISFEQAKALAERWEAQYEEHLRTVATTTRFKDAAPSEVIRMWETCRNERGQKLSRVELTTLVERWLELFGAYPPGGDDVAPDERVDANALEPEEPAPQDDTMLSPRDVERLTGISTRNIRRMWNADRFPRPLRLSPRRIGWPAREVKDWLRTLDDQRSATRQ